MGAFTPTSPLPRPLIKERMQVEVALGSFSGRFQDTGSKFQ